MRSFVWTLAFLLVACVVAENAVETSDTKVNVVGQAQQKVESLKSGAEYVVNPKANVILAHIVNANDEFESSAYDSQEDLLTKQIKAQQTKDKISRMHQNGITVDNNGHRVDEEGNRIIKKRDPLELLRSNGIAASVSFTAVAIVALNALLM